MKSTTLWALSLINAVLLCMLVAKLIPANVAEAQVGRPGDYLMIPGDVSGGNAGIVYVLDQTNRVLGAIAFDENSRSLQAMPPIPLAPIFDANRGGGGRR